MSAETNTQVETNLVLFFTDHSVSAPLEWALTEAFDAHVSALGELDALNEALEGQTPAEPGAWVVELDLIDDGPGDWPGSREYVLQAKNLRRATVDEWRSHVNGEFIFASNWARDGVEDD